MGGIGSGGHNIVPADEHRLRGTYRQGRHGVNVLTEPDDLGEETESARDYVGVADGYVDDVLSGRQVACGWVQKAARRYRAMRAKAEDPGNAYAFVEAEAVKVCTFAERCPHVEGKWPKRGTSQAQKDYSDTIELEPCQVFILVACYGFRVRETGTRLVTVVFFQIARKSAKSTLVAIAGLYHLCEEREPGAQVICAATTGIQARIVFSIMQKMVRKSGYLRDYGLRVFANAITCEAIGGNARPINSKSSTQDGLNPSFISLDESHAQTFELMDVLMSAMGARTEGVMWCPTTAGYDLTSVGYAYRQTAMKILDGHSEADHWFAVLYELDEEDDWRDESTWVKAAPMLGIAPQLDSVRKYLKTVLLTPGMQGEFETKICNRWLHSAKRVIPIEHWDQCADSSLKLEDFEGERCWIGADFAERNDIAAVSLNFKRDDYIASFVKGYLPAEVVAERARAIPEYLAWLKTEDLVVTPGSMTHYPMMEEDIRGWCGRFDVQSIVIERYGALHTTANLVESGLPARLETKNAKTFTAPMKEMLARLAAKRFRHTGCTFLRWQASNVCAERRRDGTILPTKDGPMSPLKIDAFDAILLGWIDLLEDPTAMRVPTLFIIGGGNGA